MRRGLPVERYTRKQVVIAYWGISLYWGECLMGTSQENAFLMYMTLSPKGFTRGCNSRLLAH